MTQGTAEKPTRLLEEFADKLTRAFSVQADFGPEDQLKGPVQDLFRDLGSLWGLQVDVVSEVQATGFGGRPDIGVAVGSLLAGHVELKAPGKGADPARFRGQDRRQWDKFSNLPNLIYTDGNEWALFRNGERVRSVVKFPGDVTTDGRRAVSSSSVEDLETLLQDFLRWQPVIASTPRALADVTAPLCRLLRENVLEALEAPDSNLSRLANDWRAYLFPDATDFQFGDAYAQTLTYALLLARLSGEDIDVSIANASRVLKSGHRLLADALKILGDDEARKEIAAPVDLLERVIGVIDSAALIEKAKGDPWLYFYEDFLAAYDPRMRRERGVYYTPVPVVKCQVRLVAELLQEHFDSPDTYADPKVITLDPAGGTGTYILAALQHALESVEARKGAGMKRSAATRAAKNLHSFEALVGPYAVAHLRLTQQVVSEKGEIPSDGVHVFLTDTLESPYKKQMDFPFLYKAMGEEHERAQRVKAETPVLVCLGNPPYHREQRDFDGGDSENVRRKGGWVRYGEEGDESKGILRDFIEPLRSENLGVHAKNLYNDYVYFWRWALWKVFESADNRGIVSFITASSYLRGPGFAGMRQVMRQVFDELWIIDLQGDNLGARKTENVFAIQTPVAIAVGIRKCDPSPQTPAVVRYVRLDGTRVDKLRILENVGNFKDLEWRACLSGWTSPFLPKSPKAYWDWPPLTDLFPWQENGMQFKRTWPIAETPSVLIRRWRKLVGSKATKRAELLRETRDRTADGRYLSLDLPRVRMPSISDLSADSVPVSPVRYGYRSFDRQWMLPDNRICDFPRPALLAAHGNNQIYMTSLLTAVLGEGPSAVATALLPDMDHFRGSFGAKHVIPLWLDSESDSANITSGLLETLSAALGIVVDPESLFAYCYAMLATPGYVLEFWDELTIPGPRVPLTKDSALFTAVVEIGRHLLWLHTFGQRYIPPGNRKGQIPPGRARCRTGTPGRQDRYPQEYSYHPPDMELHVGEGVFDNVRPEVWEFSVSGFPVVPSWLGYRMGKRAGRRSSELDQIRPDSWDFDEELLELLWVLEATVERMKDLGDLFAKVLQSDLFKQGELPLPKEAERKGPERLAPLLNEMVNNNKNG